MQFEKHVKVRKEKFGAVIFETLREKVLITNETGAEILSLLEGGKESKDLITDLNENYNGDTSTIENDVEEFVSMLRGKNIIKS
ncbi:MAG: PqqD family protein [Candidatus Omnitrophota bacterium]